MTQPRTNGHTVRAIRQARGLRQDHTATRSGMSKAYLSNIEAGRKQNPLPAKLHALAKVLDVDPSVLTHQVPPIETLRTIEGLTVRDLAQRAGITTARMQRIEQGADVPDSDLAAAIAARLGCPVEAITPVHGRSSDRVA